MDAFHIDAFEFCRLHEHREGEIAVADLPRLLKEAADGSGMLRWSLEGGSNLHGHPQMTIRVAGTVHLICQRCLAPFEFEFDSKSILVLADNEARADEIDTLLDDEAIEVIVGSKAMDAAALIEDDALLALPLAPKHDTCSEQLALLEPGAAKVSPFSVLKNLKH
jgi:uncharacterized protein